MSAPYAVGDKVRFRRTGAARADRDLAAWRGTVTDVSAQKSGVVSVSWENGGREIPRPRREPLSFIEPEVSNGYYCIGPWYAFWRHCPKGSGLHLHQKCGRCRLSWAVVITQPQEEP